MSLFQVKYLLEVVIMNNKAKNDINNPDKVWFRNLQTAREAKGWTQIKLAMETGISQQSITFYETGTRVPSLEVAQKLAQVLDTSIDYLVGNNDTMLKSYYKLSQKDKDAVHMVIEGLSDKGN